MLTSIMRNACGYLDRYLAQVDALNPALAFEGHELWVRTAEGDSTDDSFGRLAEEAMMRRHFGVIKADHGGPAFGSINNADRWRNIARTWNKLFHSIHDEPFDVLIYVEADLIWEPATMLALLEDLETVPAVAPMSMHATGFFYDTWGYRAGGRNFYSTAPYHSALAALQPGELLQLDSAGSCKLMRGEVAKKCRFSETDAMLGHDIYAKGYSLWLNPALKVTHP